MWHCGCSCRDVRRVDASHCCLLSLGGLGLRSAARTRESAYWASWADTLSMVQARHPSVAELMVYHLEGESWSPSLRAASQAATELDGIEGFIFPQWFDLTTGLDFGQRTESQKIMSPVPPAMVGSEASSRVEQHFRATSTCQVTERPRTRCSILDQSNVSTDQD